MLPSQPWRAFSKKTRMASRPNGLSSRRRSVSGASARFHVANRTHAEERIAGFEARPDRSISALRSAQATLSPSEGSKHALAR